MFMSNDGTENEERNKWVALLIVTLLIPVIGMAYIFAKNMDSDTEFAMSILLIVALIMAVLGGIVFPGNGRILTGYSTMNKGELAKFDMTVLSHTTGVGMVAGGFIVLAVSIICNEADIGGPATVLTTAAIAILVCVAVLTVATLKAKRTTQ